MYIQQGSNIVSYSFNKKEYTMKAWEYRTVSIEERFDKNRQVDLITGCHNFLGFKDRNGYGRIKYNNKGYAVHRLFWVLKNGELPSNIHVLHKCDNPSCFNLDHLFIGSHLDNVADKVAKNRQYHPPKGRLHHRSMAKLTEEQVKEIKVLLKRGYSHRDIAKDFKVHFGTISDISNNKTWAWV
jgi:hypothetical protein